MPRRNGRRGLEQAKIEGLKAETKLLDMIPWPSTTRGRPDLEQEMDRVDGCSAKGDLEGTLAESEQALAGRYFANPSVASATCTRRCWPTFSFDEAQKWLYVHVPRARLVQARLHELFYLRPRSFLRLALQVAGRCRSSWKRYNLMVSFDGLVQLPSTLLGLGSSMRGRVLRL